MPVWLDPELTTLAFCWRLDRRDGVTLGFTSHDRDLMLGGLLYRASPGMVPSAIEKSSGFDADSVDLSGLLASDAITKDDLIAGRWDGARLRLSAVDWTDPDTGPVLLVSGSLGSVQVEGEQFQVELRGASAALDAPVVEMTSPDCRAALGDKRCRVDMAGRRWLVVATAASDALISVGQPLVPGHFSYGTLRWFDGANAGLSSMILDNSASSLTLAEAPAFSVQPGDRAEVTEGCDRRFETCVNRFANSLNFRGEPHLPGNDLLTRYAS